MTQGNRAFLIARIVSMGRLVILIAPIIAVCFSQQTSAASGNAGIGWLGEGIAHGVNSGISAFTIADFNGDRGPDIAATGNGTSFLYDSYFGSDGVFIDVTHADDPAQPMDAIYIGGEYLFRISIVNNTALGGVSLPFRVTGDDGATWEFVEAEGFSNPPAGMSFITGIPGSRWMNGAAQDGSCWDLGGTITMYNPDGDRPDQFILGGAALNSGLDAGPLQPMLAVHFRPGGEWRDGVIGTICIDTLHYPPCGGPIFSPGGTPSFFNLPRCWPVKVMCGDANGNGDVDIFDVVLMVNYIFKDGPPPDPWQLGDANNDGVLDIGDALYLLYAAFRCGPKPECPDVPPTEPLMAPHPPLPVNSTDDRLMEMLCDSIFFRQ